MDDRLTQLEEHLAHQQRLVDELNAIVTDQQAAIDRLTGDSAKLRETVRRLVEFNEAAQDRPGEKPPHY